MEVKTTSDFRDWLADPENWQIAKPEFDRANNKAIESHDAKRAEELESSDALKREIRDLKIDRAVIEAATQHGLDVSTVRDLNLKFDDAAEVAPRIEALAATIEAATQQGINERLRTDSHTPGSGIEPGGRRDLKGTSKAEAIFLEEMGELNARLTE